jgi:hypothetical protein
MQDGRDNGGAESRPRSATTTTGERKPMNGTRAVVVDPGAPNRLALADMEEPETGPISIEIGGPIPVAVLFEEADDLGPSNARDRELG